MRPLTYEGLDRILSKTKQTDISPGLRFGLFYPGWIEREFKPESKQKREGLETVCELGANSIHLLDNLRVRQRYLASSTGSSNALVFNQEVFSQAPFVTGMGLEHPLENGFSFLHPYGLPYLPGSSVKGVARRAAEELALFEPDPKGWDIVKVWWLFGFDATSAFFPQPGCNAPHPVIQEERKRWLESYRASLDRCDSALAEALVSALPNKEDRESWERKPLDFLQELPNPEMKSVRQSLHIRGALRFWDVYPKPPQNRLRVDIMNPHYNHYYQGDKDHGKKILPPGDWGTPNPIYFLTMPAGTSFHFVVEHVPVLKACVLNALSFDKVKSLLDAAMDFAFSWLGFGAKTSIGYGLMSTASQAAIMERAPVSTRERSDAAQFALADGHGSAPERQPATSETTEQASPPASGKWKNVTLTWDAGKGEVSCSYEGQRAFAKGKDLIPPPLLRKLEKRKPVQADVDVEPLGGKNYKIVKISEPA